MADITTQVLVEWSLVAGYYANNGNRDRRFVTTTNGGLNLHEPGLGDMTNVHPRRALLWALAVAFDSPAFETGPCRTCLGASAGKAQHRVINELLSHPKQARTFADKSTQRAANKMANEGTLFRTWDGQRYWFRLACCDGTLRKTPLPSRMVLEPDYGTQPHCVIAFPRDLQVLADREMDAGRPLGSALAHWLAGKDGWVSEAERALLGATAILRAAKVNTEGQYAPGEIGVG